MKYKIIYTVCLITIVFVSIFVIGLTTALNDEPLSEIMCELKGFNNDIKITIVKPQLMINEVVMKIDVNEDNIYTYIGYDSIETIYINKDYLRLVISNSLHDEKVDTVKISLNN